MTSLRPPLPNRRSSYCKTMKTDSICSIPLSDNTCTSIHSTHRMQKTSVKPKTGNSLLLMELQRRNFKLEACELAEKIEKLHRSFVKDRKKTERKFSADISQRNDLVYSEEMLRTLREQVNQAKYLETDKFSDCSSIHIESFHNSFESSDSLDDVFIENKKEKKVKFLCFRSRALIQSIVMIKLNN